MAIIDQKLFVIRDKDTNSLMQGAKGQLAFNTAGSARKSLIHTSWWPAYKKFKVVREMMSGGNSLVNEREQLVALQAKDYCVIIAKGLISIDEEIRQFIIATGVPFHRAVKEIKFDNQPRYTVECIEQIVTKEIK